MDREQDSFFEHFAELRKKDLRRIARHTRGEYQLPDVRSEAWLLAHDFEAKGNCIDFLDPNDQNLLLSHLYQKLVHYKEQRVRHAIRLDHPARGDSENEAHPLLAKLISDDGRGPLDEMMEAEAETARPELGVHHSLASAYVHLLRRFNNKMERVAEYLLISVSHAYRCCAYARRLAAYQTPIPVTAIDENFLPGPWRRFRMHRNPLQLAFDFDDELMF